MTRTVKTVSNPSADLLEVFKDRINLAMVFYCLRRDSGELVCPKYDVFDSIWLREMFLALLGVPFLTLMTSHHTECPAYSLAVHDDKLYSVGEKRVYDDSDSEDGEDGEDGEDSDDGSGSSYSLDSHMMVWDCNNESAISRSILSEHANGLIVHQDRVYLYGYGNISVWDCKDWGLITDLGGHSRGVWCLTINDDTLYSGCSDSTIKVWNLSDYSLVATLESHASSVLDLVVQDDKLYSSSCDATIKIWSCRTKELITTLDWHKGCGMSAIVIQNNRLYSSDDLGNIIVWNCSDHRPLFCYGGADNDVSCLAVHHDKVFGACDDGTIRVCIDVTQPGMSEPVFETMVLEGHTDAVTFLAVHDDKLFSCSQDSTIKVWDCSDDSNRAVTLIGTLTGHTGDVTCLTVHKGKLYSAGADGVRVWKL